jgi:excisionase family DNA binding protein
MRNLATAQQLADYCGVPLKTVYEWNSKGTGPRFHKIGVHVRYRWEEIEKWVDAQAAKTSAAVA